MDIGTLRSRALYELKHNPDALLGQYLVILEKYGDATAKNVAARIRHSRSDGRRSAHWLVPKSVYEAVIQPRGVPMNGSPTATPSKPRNARERARMAVETWFGDVPEEHVGCLTWHVGALRDLEDAIALIDRARQHMHDFLDAVLPEARVWLKLELVPRRVRDVDENIQPDTRWKQNYEPDDIVWLVHWHGLIHVPGMTPKQMARAFRTNRNGKRSRYSGSRQVQIKPVDHNYDEYGYDKWGVGGFGEYSTKYHFEPVRGSNDNVMLFLDWFSAFDRLNRTNKNSFTHGLRRRQTCDSLDQDEHDDGDECVFENRYITNSAVVSDWSFWNFPRVIPRPVDLGLIRSRGGRSAPPRGPP